MGVIPKTFRLTQAQAAMLRNARAGRDACEGLHGRSAHGGAAWTRQSLLRRGLLDLAGGLTESGGKALELAEGAVVRSARMRVPR